MSKKVTAAGNIFLMILSATLFLASCNKEKKEDMVDHHGHEHHDMPAKDTVRETIYYCPMDTQIVQNKPGTCPICGMDLEPKPMPHRHAEVKEDWIYQPANEAVLSTVKSITPVWKNVPVKIKGSGYISYDTRRIYTISSPIGGRIDKLHVKYKYQPVRKGQPLFEIFSHELQTAQKEYLFLKRNDPDAADMISAAKNKLLLLGMTERQIGNIRDHDHVHLTTTYYSPYSGFVIEREEGGTVALAPATGMDGDKGMGSKVPMNTPDGNLTIEEGAYVSKGEAVFKVVNTELVWGILEIYSNQLPQVNINQTVHLMLENSNEMIIGKIGFIEPSYKEGTGTVKLRVYLDNKDQRLKVGNLIRGEIEAGAKKGLWIPQTAVYDLGNDKIVFVKKDGAFQTRKITVGYSSGKEVEVIGGISEGEEIAGNAQYMIDSESFVKINK